jgi:hypothetical protein
MFDGEGTNVEIAGTVNFDADDQSMEWIASMDWHGQSHLIRGLMTMEATYRRAEWGALSEPADYVLFLAYSGLVLGNAACQIRWPPNSVIVWGFHDGDLFFLGRADASGAFRLSVSS